MSIDGRRRRITTDHTVLAQRSKSKPAKKKKRFSFFEIFGSQYKITDVLTDSDTEDISNSYTPMEIDAMEIRREQQNKIFKHILTRLSQREKNLTEINDKMRAKLKKHKRKKNEFKMKLFFHVKKNNLTKVKYYIEELKVDKNITDSDNLTLLHMAVNFNCVEVCLYLLQMGVNMNSKNRYGFAALHIAVLNGSFEIIKMLLSNGCKWDIKTDENFLPWELTQEEDIKQLFKEWSKQSTTQKRSSKRFSLDIGKAFSLDIGKALSKTLTPKKHQSAKLPKTEAEELKERIMELELHLQKAYDKIKKQSQNPEDKKEEEDTSIKSVNEKVSKALTKEEISAEIDNKHKGKKKKKNEKLSSSIRIDDFYNSFTKEEESRQKELKGCHKLISILENSFMTEYLEEFISNKIVDVDLGMFLDKENDFYQDLLKKMIPLEVHQKRFISQLEKTLGDVKENQPEKWILDPSQIVVGSVLSNGAYGVVREGKLKFGVGLVPVAIKQIKVEDDVDDTCPNEMSDLFREVKIMTELNHKYILQCYGCFVSEGYVNIVLDLCKTDLFKFKKKIKTDIGKLKYLIQIAKGVSYLHEKDIVHRDLKTQNILISQDYKCKICDFGTSKSVKSFNYSFVGTVEYLAPELLNDVPSDDINPKLLDVYSFGIMIWEIWSAKRPFNNLIKEKKNNLFAMLNTIRSQCLRPNTDIKALKSMPTDLKVLMTSCWDEDPKNRPQQFEEISMCLEEIKENMKKKKKNR